jgi:hypothetical protein
VTTTATARVATPELVRQLVLDVRAEAVGYRYPQPMVIGARALPDWGHGQLDDTAAGRIEVAGCPTPLAARAALAEFSSVAEQHPDAVLVILTDLPEGSLGADVLGRFVRPKLFALNPWDAVAHRFGVRNIDPAFSDPRYSWMAEVLLDVPASTVQRGVGTLSVDAGLRAVTEHLLGATGTTVERLLVASCQPGFASRVDLVDERTVANLSAALGDRLGPAGQLVVGTIARGKGELALPAGLAARTVAGGVGGSFAQARLDELTGVALPTDAALSAWARSAELALEELVAADNPIAIDVTMVGSRLVSEWQAPFPAASDVLATSFESRLESLATLLESLLDTAYPFDPVSLRTSVHEVTRHRDASNGVRATRAQRAQLAARLVSWLRDPSSSQQGTGVGADDGPLALTAAAAAYAADGAWVDAARRRVGEGDDTPASFARVLRAISEAAHQRRALGNHGFAEALARWTTDGSASELNGSGVIAVESVVPDFVAPLAAKESVLLVVLDGCGLAAFLEFVGQFRRLGFHEVGPAGTRHSALAALPTVTEVSRTSLLSGRLRTGAAADEKRDLPAHPSVAKLEGPPAVVFHHHSELMGGIGQSLPGTVLDALGPNGPRLVAAVVNTIDDELSKGTFTAEYRLENMGPLRALLSAAMSAGRFVVITADHGHVLGVGLDGKGAASIAGDGGARWRMADREATDDEVLLRGPRVLLGDDRGILAPWHDDLRYSAKAGGYHGGATPDECLVPLSVFAPSGVPVPGGWQQVSAVPPAWWDLQVDVQPEPEPEQPAPVRRKPRKAPSGDQPNLFGDDTPAATSVDARPPAPAAAVGDAPWADRLFASDVYSVQLGAIPRGKPKEEAVRAALGALHGRGGVVNFGVIAKSTGLPVGRVPGFLANMARLLNVDGFGVLTVDQAAQEVRLDEQLLLDQFLGGATA